MKIELILLGVIGVVLLVDFLLKGIKKKDKSAESNELSVDLNPSTDNKGKISWIKRFEFNLKKTTDAIFKKKINIITLIIIIPVVKILINFYFFRLTGDVTISNDRLRKYISFDDRLLQIIKGTSYWSDEDGIQLRFIDHIELVFIGELWLFIPSILIVFLILFLTTSIIPNSGKYLLLRKKNIVLSTLIILAVKLIIHFFVYNKSKSLSYHIDNLFDEETWLFIPSALLVIFIAWYFNDKIKAR